MKGKALWNRSEVRLKVEFERLGEEGLGTRADTNCIRESDYRVLCPFGLEIAMFPPKFYIAR